VLLLFAVGVISAQVPSARDILTLSEAEQTKFVNATVEAGFPADRADQMTMLIINRSGLVLPVLERQMEIELRSVSPSHDFIATATEMIAYAGDEHALREIGKLIAIDGSKFGYLVGRTLDNSVHFRNPFTVAYRGLELGNEAVSRHTLAWVKSALASDRMQRMWAEAMLDRYGKVPRDSEWAMDPIASRLTDRESPELRRAVLSLAEDGMRKREHR
jgi:hypothetical protein